MASAQPEQQPSRPTTNQSKQMTTPTAPPVAHQVNNPHPRASFHHHFPINSAGQLTPLTLSNLSDRWTPCGRSEVGAKPAEPTLLLLAAVRDSPPNPAPSPSKFGAESSRYEALLRSPWFRGSEMRSRRRFGRGFWCGRWVGAVVPPDSPLYFVPLRNIRRRTPLSPFLTSSMFGSAAAPTWPRPVRLTRLPSRPRSRSSGASLAFLACRTSEPPSWTPGCRRLPPCPATDRKGWQIWAWGVAFREIRFKALIDLDDSRDLASFWVTNWCLESLILCG